jgi:UDP-glucose 4-epimerase
MTFSTYYAGRRVLVTGGDGFIGSHLVEALARQGARVTALAYYNSFDGAGWLDELPADLQHAVSVVRGDIRDPSFVQRLMADQEIVFHLAALIAIPYSYQSPQSYVDTNVTGSVNVFEAARLHKPARIVHTSTSETYGTAQTVPISEQHPLQGQSPYSASKIAADMMAEAFARSFELPIVTLRPFNTFGPRQSERAVIPTVIRQILDPRCEAIRIGDLRPKRDFNFVANTVDAFLHLGAAKDVAYGTPYNCGSGLTHTIGDTVELLRRLTGTNKPVEVEEHRKRPEHSEVLVLLADYERLNRLTGWTPAVNFEDGLARTIGFWEARLAADRVRRRNDYMT